MKTHKTDYFMADLWVANNIIRKNTGGTQGYEKHEKSLIVSSRAGIDINADINGIVNGNCRKWTGRRRYF